MGFPFLFLFFVFVFFCSGYGVLGVRFLYLGGIRSHNYTNVALFIKLPFLYYIAYVFKIVWRLGDVVLSHFQFKRPCYLKMKKDITRDGGVYVGCRM